MVQLTEKVVKGCLSRAQARPKPWQEEAVVKTAKKWDDLKVFLFDHPRGSGKTRLMAMLSLVAFKYKDIRCALLVVDRCDLAVQAGAEFSEFFDKCYKIPLYKQKTEQTPEVVQVKAASELPAYFSKLQEDPMARYVLVVTLQSFPHLQSTLPAGLQEKTVILADEVHRSHADKAFSEELEKAVTSKPRMLLFTGTASDRCLRLFGVREGPDFVPFHAVSEEDVAKQQMVFQLSSFKREFKQIVCDTSSLEKVAQEQQLEPRLLKAMKALSHATPAAIRLKATMLWQQFKESQRHCAYKQQMLVVAENREAVLAYAEAFKSLSQQEAQVSVYGAFSGKLQHGGVSVDEATYNKPLQDTLGSKGTHKHANILVVCDRFETGMSSDEKLIQVYSRANRRRPGKTHPKVVDFANRAQDVERAVLEFAQPRRAPAGHFDDILNLSTELEEAFPNLHDASTETIQAAVRRAKESHNEEQQQDLAKKVLAYLRGRKQGVSRTEHGDSQMMPVSVAQKIWDAMRDQEMVRARDVKQLEKEIVQEYTMPKSIRVSGHLASSSWPLAPLPMTALATPLQNMARRAEQRPQAGADHVAALQAVKDGLAMVGVGAADAEEEEDQRARCLREMKECAERLKKPRTAATARLQKASFDALHRLVSWAREAAETKDQDLAEQMITAGVEDIFRNRLQKGEPCEHQHCLSGLDALTGLGLCPRAAKMLRAMRQLQQLRKEETTPGQRTKAIVDLCEFLMKECELREESEATSEDRAEVWIFLNHEVILVLESACQSLPWSNRVACRSIVDNTQPLRALCNAFVRLQKVVAASEDREIVHKEKLCRLAQLAGDVRKILCEACYAGKRVQRRTSLAGHLSAAELSAICTRWKGLPEDLGLIVQRLGGAEAVLKLVEVAAITDGWPVDFGKEVSKLWEVVSDKEWSSVDWVEPDSEMEENGGEPPVDPAQHLRRSFSTIAASRKRKAAAIES